MKIVHWNTHHGGINSKGVLNVNGIAQALLKFDADVICLNEIEQFTSWGSSNQIGTICDILEMKSIWVTRSGVLEGRGQSNVILSKIVPKSFEVKSLHKDRSAILVTVGDTVILSTHLDNESANIRNIQATQILCWDKVRSPKMIMCGDWNTQSNSIEMAPYITWWKDAWTESNKLKTAVAFNRTGVTRNTRIDMIFYRGLNLKSCEVPDTSIDSVFPSDHHPVIAVFE